MSEIQKLEQEIYDNYRKLLKLRRDSPPEEVQNYQFETLGGGLTLLEMFGEKKTLFVIHNMGQGCSFCTLWGDGLSPFLPHLESQAAVYMVSKDSPEEQRVFANERGWRFQMASHGGGDYIRDQSVCHDPKSAEHGNFPGLVCYVREGDKIFRKNKSQFGPGDQFCSFWSVISLGGFGEEEWAPKYSYWNKSKGHTCD